MKLCPKCASLMWGENCTNVQCEEHYRTENRVIAEMVQALERKTESKTRSTPYERTRAAVYATGNKWAIENFHATHD